MKHDESKNTSGNLPTPTTAPYLLSQCTQTSLQVVVRVQKSEWGSLSRWVCAQVSRISWFGGPSGIGYVEVRHRQDGSRIIRNAFKNGVKRCAI